MNPEEALFEVAAQDMPVSSNEVIEAMAAYREWVLEVVNYKGLIEMHRPVVRRTPMTVNPLMREGQCPACDGNRWRPWPVLEGTEAIPECQYWKRAKELGLVQDA